LDKSALKLTDLTERLTESEEVIRKVEAGFPNMDKKDADTLRKIGKQMSDSIKAIREQLNGKPQEKQGYGNVPQLTVNSVMGEARSYLGSKNVAPGAQEERLMADAESMVADVLKRANNFFDLRWKQYKSLAEAAPVKLFKEYKPIE